MRTMDDVASWFTQPMTGTVETAGASFWRLIPRYAPDARMVVIRRPVADVVDSLMRIDGMTFDRDELTRRMIAADRKLAQAAKRIPGAVSVDYAALNDEATCAAIFDHCLGLTHDRDWWRAVSAVNIQIDMVAMTRYVAAYRGKLDTLAMAAKAETLGMMAHRRPVVDRALTIQTEPMEMWLAGGEDLFRQHCVTVGERPDQWREKNFPLWRVLDSAGMMQITTARSNGRMFGYLMTIIAPSMTSPSVLSGTSSTFFASPEFPGLGMKLQRAAIRSLKDRGVDEVFFEAGKRGSGPRLGAMYQRLGAVEHGQAYRLSLAGD